MILIKIALILAALAAAQSDGVALPRLHVSGNRVVDEQGAGIRLRGVNFEDPFILDHQDIDEDGEPDPHFDEVAGDFGRVKAMGANIVRLTVCPGYYARFGKKYLTDYLDRLVDLAAQNSLYALIEYHAIGRPGGWYPAEYDDTLPDHPAKLYYTTADMAVAFWNEVASRYDRRTHVLFDIYNEPADEKSEYTWADWRPMGELLIKTIRAHSDAIVLGPGPYWTSDLSEVTENPYSDSNLIYAAHMYPGSLNKRDHQGKEWERRFGFLAKRYPIMVSEWGFHAKGDKTTKGTSKKYGKPLLDYLDSKELHWVAYIYHPFAEPPMLEKDWTTLTEFGRLVRDRLKGRP
jgi:aryl-phospho-beta-D-glucosidase BglC (GH1 family)